MTQADFVAFGNLIQAVAECYGQTLSAQNVALRFRLLEMHDLAQVEHAALSIMATRKYTTMPTPADFLEPTVAVSKTRLRLKRLRYWNQSAGMEPIAVSFLTMP